MTAAADRAIDRAVAAHQRRQALLTEAEAELDRRDDAIIDAVDAGMRPPDVSRALGDGVSVSLVRAVTRSARRRPRPPRPLIDVLADHVD